MALLPVVLVVLVGGAILVAIIALAARQAAARREGLSAMAVSGDWSIIGSDNRWAAAFAGPPFGQGSDRRADDVYERVVDGQRQVAFTYQYTTYETVTSTDSNGNTTTQQQRHDHRYRVLAVALPVPLGTLRISRENLGDKLVRAFGGQDIEIEHSEFNRRYRVTADDAKLAVDLLNPRTVERLLAHPDASVRLTGGWAVVTASGSLDAAFVQERLPVVADLLAGVPHFVWRDHGYQPDQV